MPARIFKQCAQFVWRFRCCRMGLFIFVLVLTLSLGFRPNGVVAQVDLKPDEIEALESWLQTNGLTELQIELYQNQLASDLDDGAARQVARKLSRLLAAQLADAKAPETAYRQSLESLWQRFPDIGDPRSRLDLIVADYRELRQQFDQWTNLADPELIASQESAWTALIDRLDAVRDGLTAAAVEVESAPAGDGGDAPAGDGLILDEANQADAASDAKQSDDNLSLDASGKLQKAGATVDSATLNEVDYIRAWCLYCRAIVTAANNGGQPIPASEDLSEAKAIFARLLQVPPDTVVSRLRPQWFSLQSDWSCRLLVGYGMVARASDDATEADAVLTLLGSSAAPEAFRNWNTTWQVQAMVHAGQWQTLIAWADRQRDARRQKSADPTLWRQVALAGLAGSRRDATAEASQTLLMMGMRALLVTGEWDEIDYLLDQDPPDWDGDDLFAHWLKGYRHLRRARQTGNRSERAMAIEQLEPAVAKLDELRQDLDLQGQFPVRARCRYHLGTALALGGRNEQAVAQLQLAVPGLMRADVTAAEEAAWLLCQTSERLAATNMRWQQTYIETLDDFILRFPNSDRASQAQLLLALTHKKAGGLEEAYALVDSVQPDDAAYELAKAEQIELACEAWLESIDNPEEQRRWADEVARATRLLFDHVAKEPVEHLQTSSSRALLHGLGYVLSQWEAELKADPGFRVAKPNWSEEALEFVDRAPQEDVQRDVVRLYQGRLSALQGDYESAIEDAEWVAGNGTSLEVRWVAFQQAALHLEIQLPPGFEPLTDPRDRELAEAAIQQREAVLRILDSDEWRNQQKNSHPRFENSHRSNLACSIVELQLRLGAIETALERMERSRGDQAYWLPVAARVYTAARKWERAAEQWQSISRASEQGSGAWLEAQFGLVTCLSETDPEAAEKFRQQAILLVPDMPEPWASRFRNAAPIK